jgi:hypothetical protein
MRVRLATEYPYGSYIARDTTPEEGGLEFEALNYLDPNPDLPKIPQQLFRKLSKFFYDYASKSLEVHARVVYNPRDKSFRVFVPTQTIAGASVDHFEYSHAVDLETGESVSLPHKDYATLWQFHVHPFAMPGPSSIDDNGFPNQPGTGELDRPGGYGIFSCWNKNKDGYAIFTLRCNVVVSDGFKTRNKRLDIATSDVVEGVEDGEQILVYNVPYSELAHSVVSRYIPKPQAKVKGGVNLLNVQYLPKNFVSQAQASDYLALDSVIHSHSLEEVLMALQIKYDKAQIETALNTMFG